MRNLVGLLAGLLLFPAGLEGQQPEPARTPVHEPPIVVYRIELLPTGVGFAMEEPKLEGDVYVFRSLPERTPSRLPKSKVKKITRYSNDLNSEVVWQVDLNPSGRILASKEPVKKGAGYLVTSSKGGTLVSVREKDVKKITRLTGLEAFRAKEEELGVILLPGELPPGAGTGTVRGASTGSASSPAPAPGATGTPGNWTYQGKPGVTDAYAPPSAVVDRPGDVPKAPPPTPR